VIRSLRARYGAQENRHALLFWEGDSASLPGILLGLTDKPPGTYAPGDRWWPSVGCGPVGSWWALWWTRPDEKASRGGMVSSEVALWKLDEVGAVDDLRPVMEALGGESILSPSSDLLRAVAEALVSPSEGLLVVPDLDILPGLIVALWARLWPEARRSFSARAAVSPPQGGESVAPPWIYGVPPERTLQWFGHRVISAGSGSNQISRAAGWLVGETDPLMEEVRTACTPRPAAPGGLRQAARAAERLERLRAESSPKHALDLLRTLELLAPASDVAASLKNEALKVLDQSLDEEPAAFVLWLANVKSAGLPAPGPPERALGAWIRRHAPGLLLEQASNILQKLLPDRAESWWTKAVYTALSEGLAHPDPRWAAAAVAWLGLPSSADVLRDLLPATQPVEARLLDALARVELSGPAMDQVRQQAEMRGWSKLHAWVVLKALPPREAFRAQRAFPRAPLDGLAILVERLPGLTVVEEAVSIAEPEIIRLVAQRTAREPDLLRGLDARERAWRALWADHVAARGVGWFSGANRTVLGQGVLDAVLAGDESKGLVAALAEGLADTACQHPERSKLWDALSADGRVAMLPQVANSIIGLCNTGQPVPTPEPPLLAAVLSKARSSHPSIVFLASLLQWQVDLDEREMIGWLRAPNRKDWSSVADKVGRGVYSRGWKSAAKEIYGWSWSANELRPAVEACKELLSSWERFRISCFGVYINPTRLDPAPLIHRVAELGADLANDQLEDIWERAGGKRKHLKSQGAPDVRWRDAATMAYGGKLEGGLLALVNALKVDSPYNKDLRELEADILHISKNGS
jgi:GTPase-associated protein 1, N-terminal domain type 1